MTRRPPSRARGFDRGGSLVQLVAARQQRSPVRQRPAVILDVGDLEPVGPQHYGEIDDVFEMSKILSVNNRVDGQRQPGLPNQACSPVLCLLCPDETGDPVAGGSIGVL